ncbi:hypothetical protein ACHQM5_004580 [Ranunculus cassubicifolius]
MASLQRSAVSFRRQGSSGHIWVDRRECSAPTTPRKRDIHVSVDPFHDHRDETATTPNSSSQPSPLSGGSERTPKCALSAVFGKCMGSPST